MTEDEESCCPPINKNTSCCKIESVITIDERGQMVLPKDIRAKAKIKPGDKLAVVCFEKDSEVCCISLIKTKELGGMVKDLLGPMMNDITTK